MTIIYILLILFCVGGLTLSIMAGNFIRKVDREKEKEHQEWLKTEKLKEAFGTDYYIRNQKELRDKLDNFQG